MATAPKSRTPARRRRATKAAQPKHTRRERATIYSVEDLPITLLIDDVCEVYVRARSTVLRDVRAGLFEPPPFDSHPYRWRKEDIVRDLERKAAAGVRESRKRMVEGVRARA